MGGKRKAIRLLTPSLLECVGGEEIFFIDGTYSAQALRVSGRDQWRLQQGCRKFLESAAAHAIHLLITLRHRSLSVAIHEWPYTSACDLQFGSQLPSRPYRDASRGFKPSPCICIKVFRRLQRSYTDEDPRGCASSSMLVSSRPSLTTTTLHGSRTVEYL